MLVNEIEAAIDAAYGGHALDELMRAISGAYSIGALSEETYAALVERINAKRTGGAAKKAESAPRRSKTLFPPRRVQRPPDRAEAMKRRRRCALSGALPPPVGSKFTHYEIAAISVIVGQVRSTKTGDCRLCYEAIAAMAGVSRSTVKRAVRAGVQIGLFRVTQRPVKGRKNLPNIIEVIDRAAIAWIKRGPRRPISPDRGPQRDRHEYKDSKKRLPAGAAARPWVKIDPVNSRERQFYVE